LLKLSGTTVYTRHENKKETQLHISNASLVIWHTEIEFIDYTAQHKTLIILN